MQRAGISVAKLAASIGLAGLLVAAATARLQAQQAADRRRRGSRGSRRP